MSNQTIVKAELVSLTSGRTVEDKSLDVVSCIDYGASTAGTAAANTAAINEAIQAASGFVIIPSGISYTEGSLVFKDDVTIIAFSSYGTFTIISDDYDDSPISKGGIGVKTVGQSGIVLRAIDWGVTAEPLLQIVDMATGDIAGSNVKFIEMDEVSAPANPAANKSRLYTRDDGAGKTQLVVQFPTGAVQVLATEP